MNVTICVTSVTMYVMSANYICYESPKSGFFDLKTWYFHHVYECYKLQITENEQLNKTSKNRHIFNQVSSRLKIRPYNRG